ncbi:MAG: tetratricopeptide repeat protein [Fibrobacterota bacterium]|nr:tetratricopeptide repeat protein [Fibrobacterota bacterium]
MSASRWVRVRLLPVCLLLPAFFLGGCVYFNTFYNAQKAYDQATRLHEKRIDKNPEDSVLVTPDEKLKLERSIAKSSKVLELYPEEKKYQPKALFLIGESYLALGEYSKAILKYEELARFYPQAKELPTADFHRAKCLFLNGQYLAARPALEKIMNSSANPDFRLEAMVFLAKLEMQNNSSLAALELYEKLLKEHARTPEARATAHFEAAKIAFDLKLWERARGHARNADIKSLPTKLRYRCDMLAAECLYRLNKVADGIAELETMKGNRFYFTSIPEIDLKLAQGWFLLNKRGKAVELLTGIPKLAPRTAYSAEAFYRLGDHHLRDLKDEKQAKIFFDSAAAAGPLFEYGVLAAERSAALARLADLRKPADSTAKETHYRDFMIAELFLFRLESVDSALGHLDRIVQDPRQDSSHSMRAAYARAFIHDEFKKSKPVSDSLYRFVLEKYPNTDYAKQAERNLGLKPSVQTDEDIAHRLFLEAEAGRFGGGDIRGSVIPAYMRVVKEYGGTREAAKAQFVIAMLFEQIHNGEEKVAGSLDSAIDAYQSVRERYARTPYSDVAEAKLAAAGIKPRVKSPQAGTAAQGSGVPGAVNAAPANGAVAPASAPAVGAEPGTPAAVPSTPAPPNNDKRHGRGRYPNEGQSVTPEPASTADTSGFQPEDKPKEVLDNDYESVDQY